MNDEISDKLTVSPFKEMCMSDEISDKLTEFDLTPYSTEVQEKIISNSRELVALNHLTVTQLAQMGTLLAETKELVGHGNFGRWLQQFGSDERKAQRLMNLAKIDNLTELEGCDIGVSTLYLLSAPSTPAEARDEIVALAQQEQGIRYNEAYQITKKHKSGDGREDDDEEEAHNHDFEHSHPHDDDHPFQDWGDDDWGESGDDNWGQAYRNPLTTFPLTIQINEDTQERWQVWLDRFDNATIAFAKLLDEVGVGY